MRVRVESGCVSEGRPRCGGGSVGGGAVSAGREWCVDGVAWIQGMAYRRVWSGRKEGVPGCG
eukprot:1401711-Rhodomonas_salina.1